MKHPITHRAPATNRVAKIASTLMVWSCFLTSAQAQNDIITPRFMPLKPRTSSGVVSVEYREAPAKVVPVAAQPIVPVGAKRPAQGDEFDATFIRTELPGPQRLFMRDSETQFFERLARNVKKKDGTRALFPEETVVSKETYKPRNFPRMVELVEPCYVYHGRLYFEQPNFERAGYNFGVLQPGICLGVFYYDMAMLPYHIWSDLGRNDDTNVGKCLPGDPAPLLLPRERFSVTGLVGAAGTGIGLGFLFP